jgi:hypothetical protein
MRYTPLEIIIALLKTCAILIGLEAFSTILFPAIGLPDVHLAYSVLIVLYMAFKLNLAALPFLIFIVQYVHSAFSIEGWAIGTLVGVLVSISVKYLKDLLNFSTAISTIIVVQIFQIIWFILSSFLLSVKIGSFEEFFSHIWRFTPESILLSLVSPYFFILFDWIWKYNEKNRGVDL